MGLETGVDLLSIRLVAQSLPADKLIGFSSLVPASDRWDAAVCPDWDFCFADFDPLESLVAWSLRPCSLIACSICGSCSEGSRLVEPPEEPDEASEKRLELEDCPELDPVRLP